MRNTALALMLALSACRKPSKPPPQAKPAEAGALKAVLELVKTLPPCSTTVPIEWPHGWPVPAEDARGKLFKVMFYPFSGFPGREPTLSSPGAEAVVDTAFGKPTSCKRLPGTPKDLSHRRWPDAAGVLGMKEFEEREALLYSKTEAVAALYNSGRPLTPEETKAAGEYEDLFVSLAEPDLLPFYYRQNPAFWEWLRTAAGRSIPKAL